jgi:hypothetical protein
MLSSKLCCAVKIFRLCRLTLACTFTRLIHLIWSYVWAWSIPRGGRKAGMHICLVLCAGSGADLFFCTYSMCFCLKGAQSKTPLLLFLKWLALWLHLFFIILALISHCYYVCRLPTVWTISARVRGSTCTGWCCSGEKEIDRCRGKKRRIQKMSYLLKGCKARSAFTR